MSELIQQIRDCEPLTKANSKLDTELGIAVPTFISTELKFPDDVTSLASENVVRLLAGYEAEVARVRFILAQVEFRIKHGEFLINTAKKQKFASMRNQVGKSIPDTNAEIDGSVLFIDAEKEIMDLKAEKLLLDARVDIFGKYATLMGKELTRRRGESNSDYYATGKDKPEQVSRIDKLKGKEIKPRVGKK